MASILKGVNCCAGKRKEDLKKDGWKDVRGETGDNFRGSRWQLFWLAGSGVGSTEGTEETRRTQRRCFPQRTQMAREEVEGGRKELGREMFNKEW